MAEFTYKVEKVLGVLSENPNGWTKQANMVSWNNREAKLDIRDWSPDNEKMAKGITLSNKEAAALRDILNGMDLD